MGSEYGRLMGLSIGKQIMTERMNREEIEVRLDRRSLTSKEGMRYLESTLQTVPGVSYAATELVIALFQVSMLPRIKNSQVNSNMVRQLLTSSQTWIWTSRLRRWQMWWQTNSR